MEKVIREFVALILMGLALTTIKHFYDFEIAVIFGLSIIYSMYFRK